MAGLDSADSGEVVIGDASLTGMNDKQLTGRPSVVRCTPDGV